MKRMRSAAGRVLMASGLALGGMAWQSAPVIAAEQSASQKQDASVTASARGEVRRVDAAAGKVAIKHGAISDLELPAMTLVYQAKPALLANIKAGDHVRFTATRRDGKYMVTEISNSPGL